MTDADLQVLAKSMAPAVKAAIEQATAPLLARIAVLEQRAPVHGRDGKDGERGSVGERGEKGLAGDAGPVGLRGEKGDAGIGSAGERGLPGERGEKGLDGQTGAMGSSGAIGERGERGERGLDGRDGKDGRDGQDGADGPQGATGEKGLNGANGTNGLDGLGFDDLNVDFDGERSFSFVWRQGERVKTFGPFKTATVLHRGVHRAGQAYEKGDQVSWNGSTWIAMQDTTARPGGPDVSDRAWVLSSKSGSPGKQGAQGAKGIDGHDGQPGRDLTHRSPEGHKW